MPWKGATYSRHKIIDLNLLEYDPNVAKLNNVGVSVKRYRPLVLHFLVQQLITTKSTGRNSEKISRTQLQI